MLALPPSTFSSTHVFKNNYLIPKGASVYGNVWYVIFWSLTVDDVNPYSIGLLAETQNTSLILSNSILNGGLTRVAS